MYTLEINHYNLDVKIETEDFKLLLMLQAIIKATYEYHVNRDEEEDEEEEEIIVTKKKK